MKILLWLDDCRNPTDYEIPCGFDDVLWVKSFYSFVDWINRNGLPSGISFDHDLADIESEVEKTGYDAAKWLSAYCIDNGQDLPECFIHSANPVGAENIYKFLKNHCIHYG